MTDFARTALFAWRYPGREQLPAPIVDQLVENNLMPDSDDAKDENWYGDDGADVLAGDESSGAILALLDEEANYGTGAYTHLINALGAAGLHVYAGNDAGGDYDACWEYYPPADTAGTVEWRRWGHGEFVIGANDLLTDGYGGSQRCPKPSS